MIGKGIQIFNMKKKKKILINYFKIIFRFYTLNLKIRKIFSINFMKKQSY